MFLLCLRDLINSSKSDWDCVALTLSSPRYGYPSPTTLPRVCMILLLLARGGAISPDRTPPNRIIAVGRTALPSSTRRHS